VSTSEPSASRTVLFHRNYRAFTGGHLKVWHYFNHVRASEGFNPRIYFTPRSRRGASNPWCRSNEIVPTWAPGDADVLFLAGMDWKALPTESRDDSSVPIINFVQGFRHAEPTDPRYEFLRHRAIRICVSPKIEEALRGIEAVNGPLLHIPMGLDQTDLPLPRHPENDILIAAVKAPRLGRKLRSRLHRPGRRIVLLTKALPRAEYLRQVANSRVALFLPLPYEGCYMPPLEAMAMRRVVICPDDTSCEIYSTHGHDIVSPAYTIEAITEAAEAALAMSDAAATSMADHAVETAAGYTIEREREAFGDVLGDVDALWEN
jgi:hypothetical protein